jgi:hypothetical protein
MLFRLYIGSNNTTKKLESQKAVRLISKTFQGFTISKGSGYWQGKLEKNLIVEIETQKEKEVKKLGRLLCIKLKQQAVGVAKIGKMSFIS